MNEFDLIKNKLTNRRSFGAFLKTVDLPWLIDLREKIDSAINDLEKIAKEQQKKEEEKQEQKAEILKLMEAAGLSLNDFVSAQGDQQQTRKNSYSPRGKAEPKFKFLSSDGTEKTWTGRGRMPVELAAMLKEGKSLDDFLIDK